jgi:hypothetical protein
LGAADFPSYLTQWIKQVGCTMLCTTCNSGGGHLYVLFEMSVPAAHQLPQLAAHFPESFRCSIMTARNARLIRV